MAIINKETIISAFDEKMTLLQWLKNVEKALIEGILKDVKVVKVNEGLVKFVFTFEDGTTQETNEIVLSEVDIYTLSALIEGSESIVVDINESNTALEIHIDADVMQKINRSLTLPLSTPTEQKIVGVDRTNSQNLLGLGEGLQIENDKVKVGGTITDAEVIEPMEGYSFIPVTNVKANINYKYVGVVKNGNKITFVVFFDVTALSEITNNDNITAGYFNVPTEIGARLFPTQIANVQALAIEKSSICISYANNVNDIVMNVRKPNQNSVTFAFYPSQTLLANTTGTIRLEKTFLLSDNLVEEVGGLD